MSRPTGPHYHICESCWTVWGHLPPETPKKRDHHCPRCGVGPFVNAYDTREEARTANIFNNPNAKGG